MKLGTRKPWHYKKIGGVGERYQNVAAAHKIPLSKNLKDAITRQKTEM